MTHDIINVFIGVGSALSAGMMALFGWVAMSSRRISEVEMKARERTAQHNAMIEALRDTDSAQWKRIDELTRDIKDTLKRMEDRLDRELDKKANR